MELVLLFLIGLVFGLKHAFDADHIVAVNTLLTKSKNLKKSLKLGFFWGLGHTTTLFLVGGLFLILDISIPNKLALFFELIVGLMLIFLGVSTMHKSFEKKLRKYDGSKKSFGIGIVHGVAGSAALMLLIISKIQTIYIGLVYILIFGIGTIFGMIFVSFILFYLLNIIKNKNLVSNLSGTLSILLGLLIIIDIGFF